MSATAFINVSPLLSKYLQILQFRRNPDQTATVRNEPLAPTSIKQMLTHEIQSNLEKLYFDFQHFN